MIVQFFTPTKKRKKKGFREKPGKNFQFANQKKSAVISDLIRGFSDPLTIVVQGWEQAK